MNFFAPVACLIAAVLLHWLALGMAIRRKSEIYALAGDYADRLFETKFLPTLIFRSPVRVETLMFVSPPEQLKGVIGPIRRLEFVALVFLLLFVVFNFSL